MPRDKHRADQERRRATYADQNLAEQQHVKTAGHAGDHRASDGQRKRHQHSAPHTVQVNTNTHEELHHAKRQVKSPGEKTQGLCA